MDYAWDSSPPAYSVHDSPGMNELRELHDHATLIHRSARPRHFKSRVYVLSMMVFSVYELSRALVYFSTPYFCLTHTGHQRQCTKYIPAEIIDAFDPLVIEGSSMRAPPAMVFSFVKVIRYLTILLPLSAFLVSLSGVYLTFTRLRRRSMAQALRNDEATSVLPQYLNEKLLPPSPRRRSLHSSKVRSSWQVSRLGFIALLTLHLVCVEGTASTRPIFYTRSPKRWDGSGGVVMITIELLQRGCLDWIGYAFVALFCGLVDPEVAGL